MGNNVILNRHLYKCPDNFSNKKFNKIIKLYNKIDKNNDKVIDISELSILINYYKKEKGIKLTNTIKIYNNQYIKKIKNLDAENIIKQKQKLEKKINKIKKYSNKILNNVLFIYTELFKEFKIKNEQESLKNILINNHQSRMLICPDKPYTIIHVNNKFCKLVKYKKNELIGESFGILNGELTCKKIITKIDDAMLNKKNVTFVLTSYKKSDISFINQLTLIPILSNKKQLCYYLIIIKEISEEYYNNNILLKTHGKIGIYNSFYIHFWDFFNYIKNKDLNYVENLLNDIY